MRYTSPTSDRRHPLLQHTALRALMLALVIGGGVAGCSDQKQSASPSTTPGTINTDTRRRLEEAQSLAAQAGKAKDPDKAIALYDRAVKTYSELPAAWNNMGVLLMKRGRRQDAEHAFETAAELAPNDPRPMFNRGLNWFEAKYPNQARNFFRLALERDPNYLPALRGAIESDVLTRQTSEETLDLLRRALFLEPDKRWRERFELQKSRIESYQEVEQESTARKTSGRVRSNIKGDLVDPPPVDFSDVPSGGGTR